MWYSESVVESPREVYYAQTRKLGTDMADDTVPEDKCGNFGILDAALWGAVLVISSFCPDPELKNHENLRLAIHLFREVLDRAGDALVIAALIAIIVDKSIKTQLVRETVRAASPYLIAKHLPRRVQEFMIDYLQVHFVRPDWIIEYTFTTVPGKPGFLKLFSSIRGVVQNFSDKQQIFKFVASIDQSFVPVDVGTSTITRVGFSEEYGPSFFDQSPPANEYMNADGSWLFEHEEYLRSKGRYTTIVQTEEYVPESYVMPLFTSTTVSRSEVRVFIDRTNFEISLEVPSAPELLLKPVDTAKSREWLIDSVLLPGQALIASWSPLKNQQNAVSKETSPNIIPDS